MYKFGIIGDKNQIEVRSVNKLYITLNLFTVKNAYIPLNIF
jgi:hypothetical protein